MADQKVKVLYIAGSGRSGSTIIGRILGQVDGFFFAGEVCKIWEYGLMENRKCGCGEAFRTCVFWREVFEKAYGGKEPVNGHELHDLRKKSASMRHIPLFFLPGGKRLMSRRIEKFSCYLEKLYRSIREQTNCDVIIDCSKSASYGYLLDLMDSIDLYVVHIIRDPRGVAHEKLQRKLYQPADGPAVFAGRYGLLESSLTWDVQNLAAESFWKGRAGRYMSVHYEAFVDRPKETIEGIIRMLGEEPADLPFVEERKVRLNEGSHSAAGNPVRFHAGIVEIRPDMVWTEKMDAGKQLIVTFLTWPLFLKYKYHNKR